MITPKKAYNKGFEDGYRRGRKEGKEEMEVRIFNKIERLITQSKRKTNGG